MCSSEASRYNITTGMKLSEARAVCADLIWKEYDETLYCDAQKLLTRHLISCSPKVSALEYGIFLLDASGLNFLGGEDKFCRQVQKITGRGGYADAHIGIADSAFAATVASKFKRRQYFIVKEGDDAAFLGPLSIKHLPVSPDTLESLYELGIRTIAQMVALGQQSLNARFGTDGFTAFELATGADTRQPYIPQEVREFKSSVELGAPIELLHEIQFVLKSMLDRLSKELKQESLWAEELKLAFINDDELFDERTIKLLQPSNHQKFLLEVIKLSLEANPIKREITGMILAVSRFSNETWEQSEIEEIRKLDGDPIEEESNDLSNELSGKSMSLALMLQRFVSRFGEDIVVRSISNDQHAPEHAGAWLPIASKPAVMPVVPVNVAYINTRVPAGSLVAGLALRKCKAPQPVLIELNGDMPTALTFEGRWYIVREITEPERLSGLWWEQPLRKSYYVAMLEPREARRSIVEPSYNEMSTGMLVSLVHDHEANGWFINGFYD